MVFADRSDNPWISAHENLIKALIESRRAGDRHFKRAQSPGSTDAAATNPPISARSVVTKRRPVRAEFAFRRYCPALVVG
jgi:hypothetical protein